MNFAWTLNDVIMLCNVIIGSWSESWLIDYNVCWCVFTNCLNANKKSGKTGNVSMTSSWLNCLQFLYQTCNHFIDDCQKWSVRFLPYDFSRVPNDSNNFGNWGKWVAHKATLKPTFGIVTLPRMNTGCDRWSGIGIGLKHAFVTLHEMFQIVTSSFGFLSFRYQRYYKHVTISVTLQLSVSKHRFWW